MAGWSSSKMPIGRFELRISTGGSEVSDGIRVKAGVVRTRVHFNTCLTLIISFITPLRLVGILNFHMGLSFHLKQSRSRLVHMTGLARETSVTD